MDLEQFIAQHQGALFAFLYRMVGDQDLAEELMQVPFVRALQAAGRYRPQGKVSTSDNTEEKVLLGIDVKRVRKALLELPFEQRSAIMLRYYHDLTYAEIAEASRRSPGGWYWAC
ncbi:MAG TPA: RNA polymerase sigma factor [Symbiobacteriaceae bacterium]